MNLKKTIGLAAVGLSLMFAGSAFAESYLVIAKGNNFSKNMIAGIESAGGTVRHVMNEVGLAIVDSDNADFQTAAASVKGVHAVPHDISLEWQQPFEGELLSADTVEPPFTGDDDFWFDLQWGHDAIDAQDAWAKGHRGAGARVAVLDSGIDADHYDLVDNINADLSVSFVVDEPWDTGVLQPFGSFNHGTHVAGTIAALDNGWGTIGVAPEAEIVAVKVLSQFTSSGGIGGILLGMAHAAIVDADVINMSLGGTIPRNCTFGSVHFPAWECAEIWTAGTRVANFAREQGTLIIASAGNNGRDLNHDGPAKEFPNDLPGVVSVSATGPIGWALDPFTDLDLLADYSNYGTSGVDFAAPGGNFGLFPIVGLAVCEFIIVDLCVLFDTVYSTINGSGPEPGDAFYTYSAGTSMAAPHATGVAALIIGANGGPMTPAAVIAAMKAGADDLGKPGKDEAYGHGRVNAANSTP